MKRVLAFGSFDPLHEGHKDFFRQAKVFGEQLTVVVAHDQALSAQKGRLPFQPAEERFRAVAATQLPDRVLIGDKAANQYALLRELDFDVIALGYDQEPTDGVVRAALDKIGKQAVEIVRLKPYHPEKYKSSLARGDV